MRTYLCAGLFFLGLQSCAHHRDVRVGEDGLNTVKLQTERRSDGFEQAMSQAEHYCEQYKKRPVHVSEKTDYVGSMNEDTYNTVKTGIRIAQAGGMGAAILGGKKERNVGLAAGIGGTAVGGAIENGYQYALTFKCVD